MRLHDKVAIITGAGRGIGRATALRFAEEGARVVCADLDLAFVTEVADEINARARAGANGRAVHAAEGTPAEGNGVKPVLTPTAYALPVRVNVADAATLLVSVHGVVVQTSNASGSPVSASMRGAPCASTSGKRA